jgi:hypothetical protein
MSEIKVVREKKTVNFWKGLIYTFYFPDGSSETSSYTGFNNRVTEADVLAIKQAKETWFKKNKVEIVLSNGKISIKDHNSPYSISGNEFLVTNGTMETQPVYSPPWNDFEPEEELANAMKYVEEQENE